MACENRTYRLHLESGFVLRAAKSQVLYSIPLEVAGLQEHITFGETLPMSATSQFWYATNSLHQRFCP